MASKAVSDAVDLLRSRLMELEAERKQLEDALSRLADTSARRPRAASGTRTRARRGQRDREFFAHVEANPGAKIGDVAKALNIKASQLYPVAKRLSGTGRIEKKGDGFYVSEANAKQG